MKETIGKRLSKWATKAGVGGLMRIAVKSFIKEELLRLAEEIQNYRHPNSIKDFEFGKNIGYADAANLLTTEAKSLE